MKMEVLGWGTGEGLPKNSLLDEKGKLINAWKRSKGQMSPGKQRSGEELPTDSRRQGKCSSGKTRRREGTPGLVPISGGQGRNPYKERKSLQRAEIPALMGLSAGQDRQWWQITRSQMGKPSRVWENACRNQHRIAADSFPSLPELNYNWKPGKIPAGFRCSMFEQGRHRQWWDFFNLPFSSKWGGEENLSLLEWGIELKSSRKA